MRRDQILNQKDPPNGLGDQCLNAGIVAGYAFFSTLAAIAITQLSQDWKLNLAAAAIAAGLSFFGSLMTQRGLKKETP